MRGGDAQSEEAEGDKAEKQGKIVRFSRLYCHIIGLYTTFTLTFPVISLLYWTDILLVLSECRIPKIYVFCGTS